MRYIVPLRTCSGFSLVTRSGRVKMSRMQLFEATLCRIVFEVAERDGRAGLSSAAREVACETLAKQRRYFLLRFSRDYAFRPSNLYPVAFCPALFFNYDVCSRGIRPRAILLAHWPADRLAITAKFVDIEFQCHSPCEEKLA